MHCRVFILAASLVSTHEMPMELGYLQILTQTKQLFVVVERGEEPPLQDFLVIIRETERNRQNGHGEKHVSYRSELILRAIGS